MGNSMGGMIASLVAGHRADLVESLVLVNPGLPAPLAAATKVPATALALFAPFVLPGVGERLMRQRYERMDADQLYDDTLKLIVAHRDRLSTELLDVGRENARRGMELDWRLPGFAQAAESLMALLVGPSRASVHRALESIVAPTLLLWGDRDRLVGESVIDGTAERRPDWDVHVWSDVGHVPMMEVPDAFLDVVSGWLDSANVAPAVA
jgi:pimeloyl-ACP methyl ester carboxylesterase